MVQLERSLLAAMKSFDSVQSKINNYINKIIKFLKDNSYKDSKEMSGAGNADDTVTGLKKAEYHAVCVLYTQLCAVLRLVTQLCPTLFDPMDCSSPGSSVHGDSPGRNTGVGCHAFPQEIFPTQGLNPGLPH